MHASQQRLWRAGRTAWAILGLIAVILLAGYLASRLSFILLPVVLALFPATLLMPFATWLQQYGLPAAGAALLTLLIGILLLFGVIAGIIVLVIAQLPDLIETAKQGIVQFEQLLAQAPAGVEERAYELLERLRAQLGEAGDLALQAIRATLTAFETLAGGLLLLVILFFYLKDGQRLTDGIIAIMPGHPQRLAVAAEKAWNTLGAYFHGQLLVALVDAVLIGLGLFLWGVPLALPLAVLIFFGGLFPIIGAVVTGGLAVLIALADGGLGIGLAVFSLVLLVQQLESNLLAPFILGQVTPLHPLLILLSITGGALLFGVLGAFLAVPLTAIAVQVLPYFLSEE
jgi:putative heme transporter